MSSSAFGSIEVIAKQGDLVDEEVDAIVVPANSYLVMDGGVAAAVKLHGGLEIESEAVGCAPLRVGEACLTGGGRLRAAHVIHAPTMEKPIERADTQGVRRAMRAALACAESHGIQTLSVPGMGTGTGGLAYPSAAREMVLEVASFSLEGPRSLRLVTFVARNSFLLHALLDAIESAAR
jgi:O-acetyl-ADP-ribose deacetylase (regulator of RNase III)